jgi:hypothetical protein
MAPDFQNEGSAENRPVKEDYYLPGGGVYTFSRENTGRIFMMRLEYTYDTRPEIDPGDFKVTGFDFVEDYTDMFFTVDWTGNIGWDGFDKVQAVLVDSKNGVSVPASADLVSIMQSWEVKNGENKQLRLWHDKSGEYSVKLIGTRETGEYGGMINENAGVVLSNYNSGYALESGLSDPFILDLGVVEPDKMLESIEVVTPPKKTEYTSGEAFSGEGMVVIATYSDATKAIISDYVISPSRALKTSDTSVEISYTEDGVTKTAYQDIIVSVFTGPGDINEDGIISTVDFVMIKFFIINDSETIEMHPAMDVNGDGIINAIDLTFIRAHILRIAPIVW